MTIPFGKGAIEQIVDKTNAEKIWGSSPSEGPWLRFAQLISEMANPLFIALPTFLVIALVTAPDILHALLWWGVAGLGISLAPFFFILHGVRRGYYSDHHVSIREQRGVPLFFGLGCFLTAFLLLFLLNASRPLIATVAAALVALGIATAITKFWKISLHLVGITGAVTVFLLMFGPLATLLVPLVLLVGWARWRVRAHTFLQAVAGTTLAVAVTIGTFWQFGLLK